MIGFYKRSDKNKKVRLKGIPLHLLNFVWTDSNATFNIVVVSFLGIMKLKQVSNVDDKAQKCLTKNKLMTSSDFITEKVKRRPETPKVQI